LKCSDSNHLEIDANARHSAVRLLRLPAAHTSEIKRVAPFSQILLQERNGYRGCCGSLIISMVTASDHSRWRIHPRVVLPMNRF
jgi:hypothetical protein